MIFPHVLWQDPHGRRSGFSRVHESPRVMTVPLIVLAVGAIGAGFRWNTAGARIDSQLPARHVPGRLSLPVWFTTPSTVFVLALMAVSTLIAVLGILIAYSIHIRRSPSPEAVAGVVAVYSCPPGQQVLLGRLLQHGSGRRNEGRWLALCLVRLERRGWTGKSHWLDCQRRWRRPPSHADRPFRKLCF